ncbi:hypothetical protein FSARC_13950 [Fusarium sarcochroum]|uniref:DUF521 domain-containing protein n=1 Tax=Fusarium sarcochroum TaxID=1208366 RepID=A0A8H4SXS1_9HYPO|nr:hypothetical protein FSARC_13950 [Fusarium sarcochroum]
MRSEVVPLPGIQIGIRKSDNPLAGRFLITGEADGEVVFSNTPISFMMGVHIKTGIVIDEHHPLLGTSLKNKVVVFPRGRGSCGASGVIMELLRVDAAPAALVFRSLEEILTLGVLVADAMFSKSIPIVLVEDQGVWEKLAGAASVEITRHGLRINDDFFPINRPYEKGVVTTPEDDRILRGEGCSRAAQIAMELIVEFASIQGAKSLIDISQVHIDACCYAGKVSLLVPQRLSELGGKVMVPSTCNSLDVDIQRWRALGSDPELSEISSAIGEIYLAMGAMVSFTCAPYLLETKPKAGDQVGWGESNAVVFANSVLGARTQKYPDYLDIMIALVGRAPAMGCHLDEGRQPQIAIQVPDLSYFDESVFPLLGYHIGSIVGGKIPIIYGMEASNARIDADLKAFGAGFATTSSAPMFHIKGITPESFTVIVPENLQESRIEMDDLRMTWKQLNTAADDTVGIIALGNPHFALEEFLSLIKLTKGRTKHSEVEIVITLGRFIYQQAKDAGYLEALERFGAKFINDTCWCMLQEPVVPRRWCNIMTNSAKYAHYGPGITGKKFHFGSMAACVEAACTGKRHSDDVFPRWLFG